ncbi:unnamed protein product [Blepharisma stoltei]|uniref:Uncharacterized protein n=1 Tax=Blepharisma stoltei TaxID=1481888 RepID=A0AAU9IJQ2_9CILI|nr:unnamed protein product [Blepharisma stoltei]
MRNENEFNMMQEESKEFYWEIKNSSQMITICSGLKERCCIAVCSALGDIFCSLKGAYYKNLLFDKLKINRIITNKNQERKRIQYDARGLIRISLGNLKIQVKW